MVLWGGPSALWLPPQKMGTLGLSTRCPGLSLGCEVALYRSICILQGLRRAPPKPSRLLLWSVFSLTLRAEQSPGEDANFSQPLVGVEDVEQEGTDRNLEGDLCNCRTTEAEGTSGGHSVGPSLMLDEAAQGPVQSSYLQGWRSHQLPVPVFVMETSLFCLQLKFFWL